MGDVRRSRRSFGRATGVVALVAGAVVPITLGDPAPVAAAGECGPLGTLIELELNDRCDFGNGGVTDDIPEAAIAGALAQGGLFSTQVRCRNGDLISVVARPDEVLVSAVSAERLAVANRLVRQRLGQAAVGDTIPVNALASRIQLRPGTLTASFLRTTIPRLQSTGWSADLNYLEPALPNDRFRPADDPEPAAVAPSGRRGAGNVLVVDSPADPKQVPTDQPIVTSTIGPAAVYDLDGNRLIDEDHGHGVFVASLIERLAPGANVVLAGVNGRQVPGVARWSPMMFSDADLIQTMGLAFGLSPGGAAVRRSYDVVNLSLGGSGCDGIAVRLPLGRFMRRIAQLGIAQSGRPLRFVAAAGNDGGDVKHFPAAWRDTPTIEEAAKLVDAALGGNPTTPFGDDIRAIQAYLRVRTYAVGSWSKGVQDPFSNCGTWVNAVADGAGAVSRYPAPSTWASWSGTSFSTPRVSAALVGANVSDASAGAAIGAC